uniref:Photosystem II reaction center protein Z n=1 Tax=Euglena viridis TaxID=3040 RepID=A0A0G3VGK2_EUGVI|nr:photosystem II protein Z [Euglena viridis]
MLLLSFQISLLALVAFSFLMVVAVPVVFASPNGWNENKNFVLVGAAMWTGLVLLVGTLNSFVI